MTDSLSHLDISTETREKAAEKGEALPDGSYPIRNKGDLSRAIQSFGRASDKVKVKKWIIKRARELDAVDMLPDSWGVDADIEHSMSVGSDFIAALFDEDSDLSHHGVLGMKWGIRKDRSSSGGSSSGKPQTGPKRANVPQSTVAKKQAARSEDSDKTNTSSENQSGTAKPNPQTKSDGRISDDDLRAAINRMQLEKQYSQLMAERNPQKARASAMVKKIVADSAKNAASQVMTNSFKTVGTYAMAAAFAKGGNLVMANAMMKGIADQNKKDKGSDDSPDLFTKKNSGYKNPSKKEVKKSASSSQNGSSNSSNSADDAYDRAYKNSSEAVQNILDDLAKLRK